MSVAEHVVLWTLVYVSIPVNLYPLFYAFRPWRSTPQGRALMIKALGNMGLIDVILAYWLFGDYFGRQVLRAAMFVLFAVGMTYLFVTLLRAPNAREYPPFTWIRWVTRRQRS